MRALDNLDLLEALWGHDVGKLGLGWGRGYLDCLQALSCHDLGHLKLGLRGRGYDLGLGRRLSHLDHLLLPIGCLYQLGDGRRLLNWHLNRLEVTQSMLSLLHISFYLDISNLTTGQKLKWTIFHYFSGGTKNCLRNPPFVETETKNKCYNFQQCLF